MIDLSIIGLGTIADMIFWTYLSCIFLGAFAAISRLIHDDGFEGIVIPKWNKRTKALEPGFLMNVLAGGLSGLIIAAGGELLLLPFDAATTFPRVMLAALAGYSSASGIRRLTYLKNQSVETTRSMAKIASVLLPAGLFKSFSDAVEDQILRQFKRVLKDVSITQDLSSREINVLVQGLERLTTEIMEQVESYVLSLPGVWGVAINVKQPEVVKINLNGRLEVTHRDRRGEIESQLREKLGKYVSSLPAGRAVSIGPLIGLALSVDGVKDLFDLTTTPPSNADNEIPIGNRQMPLLETVIFT